ncbi:hypothetical protein GCK32_006863, partial [Trichostrongylus colubriformis]
NPNHFNIPFRTKLLPRCCSDIQVCGFCFWCGYSPQFVSHIASHGYIDIGVDLSEDPIAAFPVSLLSTDPETIDSENLLPNKILGPAGREVFRQLKGGKGDFLILLIYGSAALGNAPKLLTMFLISEAITVGASYADNTLRLQFPNASADNRDSDVHAVEIFVPRSECSSASDLTRTNEHSPAGRTDGATTGERESGDMSDKEEPLFSDLVVPKGECAQTGGSATIRITASTSDPAHATDAPSTTSPSNDNQEQDVALVYGPDNIDVQEHKMIIHRKFLWEGPPPPPLNAEQTQQLVCLARNECPFCSTARGSRGLRIPQFANDEIKEESMLAHVVKFHHKDPAAAWVLNAKRFHMSTGGRQTPLKFLLEPTKDGWLQCSSCEKASFDRIANLRVHWACCVNVCGRYRKDLREGRLVLESPSTFGKPPKRRSKNEAVKCPMPTCVSAWRPSFKYPNAVTQIAHMISHHGADKEAYETALKLGESEKLADEFPFLDVAKSFANSINSTDLCLQCANGAPKCPFGCSKRLQRLKSGITDNVLRLLHVMICHLPDEDAATWVKNWMRSEKAQSAIEKSKERASRKRSLMGMSQTGTAPTPSKVRKHPSMTCNTLIEGHKYFAHRRRGSVCYDRTGISEKAQSAIEKSKERASRKRSLMGMSQTGTAPTPSKVRKHPSMTC